MGCFSCFKPPTSEDDTFDAQVQEDEELALAIQKSKQEEEERRRTRELEEEHQPQERGERQNYDNNTSSSSALKDGQSSEEKDKRKQFEEGVKQQDEQLAVTPPPRLPLDEHNNISSEALLEEGDEQRVILESLKEKGQTKPSDDGKLVEGLPPPSMCGGCHSEIDPGGSVVDVLGVPWHPECFSCGACHNPIAIHEVENHVSTPRGKFHKNCYYRYCYVCQEKVKIREYKSHPFWKELYCPAHESDGTHKCFSCERLKPKGTDFVMLDDGRWLCLECMDSAVMDTYEAHDLHLDIREFFHGLNMEIHKEFPLLLVEKQALNLAEKKEKIQDNQYGVVTRGICLSEVQIVTSVSKGPEWEPNKQRLGPLATESQRVESGCPVTAILILYGLPRLLTGSIMAHEMMHAYLRLNGLNNLNKVLEEGLCQVLGHMWLETQRYSPNDLSAASSSSSSSNAVKKGECPEFEKKLVEFCKNQIETDDSQVYGVGFTKVHDMVTNSNLHETLKQILRRSRG